MKILFLLLGLTIIAYSGVSQSPASLENEIDSIVINAINNKAFPGCVVFCSKDGDTFFNKAYGYHTYDSLTKVKKNHLYDLASVTKMMAGTISLMKLYDESLLDLDEEIGNYIQGIGKTGKVTIREAMAHQGGLDSWIPYYREIKKTNNKYKANTISKEKSASFDFMISDSLFLHNEFYEKKIKKMIRKSKLGAKEYKYSGLFFYLIPELVKNVSGIEYEKYLRSKFYDLLQLDSILFSPLANFNKSIIVPTEIDTFFRNKLIHGEVHDEGAIFMKGVSGNAGLFGTANQINKLFQVLLNGGIYDSIQYLSPQTIDLFTTAQYPNNGNRRGIGFDKPLLIYDSIKSSVAKNASFRSYGHTGYTGTLIWADPLNDMVFVFLSNRVYPNRKQRNIYKLNVRPTIHQLFYDYFNE